MAGPSSPEPARPEALVWLGLLLAGTGTGLATIAGPPAPGRLPVLPSWVTLEVLAQSPNPPMDGVLQLAVLAAWLVWAWAAVSVAVELALTLAERGPAQGAAWLRSARVVADHLTLPLARRAVAAAVVVQLAMRPALPALAFAAEPSALVLQATVPSAISPASFGPLLEEQESEIQAPSDAIEHVVQRGDTLWSIAARYYGSGEEFDRVIDANIGRQMPDGRVFDRAGLIYPGWVLEIPLPSTALEEHDGARWYVVQRGDTLSGIAARLLGSEDRYHELFELNVGTRLGEHGPELRSPNLIWPGLRLRLPDDLPAAPEAPDDAAGAGEPQAPTVSVPEPTSETAAPTLPAPASEPAPSATPAPLVQPTATVEPTQAPGDLTGVAPALPTSEPDDAPALQSIEEPDRRVPVDLVPLAAAGVAGVGAIGLGLAGARVLRRRRRRQIELEPAVGLEQGFALADPARVLGQRLAGEGEAPAEIVDRLARAYAVVLGERLSGPERAEVFGQVELVSVRHGRTSTTCVLSAPPAARGHLLRHLETAVAHAFGDAVDIEGLVSHDGDLFIQLAGIDQRRLRVAVPDRSASDGRLWADPFLVPLALLPDRQTLYANWHALGHVLVAAPLGQAAEPVLMGLVASLVARRPPSDLALVTLATYRTLPSELLAAPHQLLPIVDPADDDAVRTVFQQLRDELDRHAAADAATAVDIVVIVRELGDLRREHWDLLGPVLSEGPHHGIRVLAASERPTSDLLASCPALDDFRTRLVLQTADEDASQALLGAPGAEELGAGGHLLLRLEGRTPVRAHGFRVAPDHLPRLVALMHAPPSPEPAARQAPASPVSEESGPELSTEVDRREAEVIAGAEDSGEPEDHRLAHRGDEPNIEDLHSKTESEGAVDTSDDGTSAAHAVEDGTTPHAPTDAAPVAARPQRPRSDLLRQLDQAPLRLRSFGTRGVWLGERQIWPSAEAVEETGWELVVLLGIHPVAGVQAETLADMIWDEETPDDPGTVLRKRRRRLRNELKRLVPELEADPLPTDPKGRVYRLDPGVIASDVHQFVELATWAKSLPREDAIAAYEEALVLYQGDLLDSVAVPTYSWLYDGAALAISLRPEYNRLQQEVRHRLADLYAVGNQDDELGRAVALYTELTGERPDDDGLWVSLLRARGRRGDAIGLQASLRRLRTTLVELGHGDDPDKVALPPKVLYILDEVQAQARASGQSAAG